MDDDRVEAQHERAVGETLVSGGSGLLGGERSRERLGVASERRVEFLGRVDDGRIEGQAEPLEQPSSARRLREASTMRGAAGAFMVPW